MIGRSQLSIGMLSFAVIVAILIPTRIIEISASLSTQQASSDQSKKILHISTFDASLSNVVWVGWNSKGSDLAIRYEDDKKIRIIDSSTGSLKLNLEPSAAYGSIRSVEWSPNGDFIACTVVAPDEAIYIWNVSSGTSNSPIILNQTGQRSSLSWSPDSSRIMSVGAFGQFQDQFKLFVWDVSNRTQVKEFEDSNAAILYAWWSPDGKHVAVFNDGDPRRNETLQIRDSTSLDVLSDFPNKNSNLSNNLSIEPIVSWSLDGSKLAGALCNEIVGSCSLWIWDIKRNTLSQHFEVRQNVNQNNDNSNVGAFEVLALSPDGNRLAVNDRSGSNIVWDVKSGRLISSLDGKTGWVSSLAWNPDGTLLATGNEDGSVDIWQINGTNKS